MEIQSLQSSLAELNASFNARMAHFEAELPKSSHSTAPTSVLAGEFASFKVFIKETLNTLQRQIEVLARQVDAVEMRSRRKMLLLHGVTEKKSEEVADVVASVIKTHLNLPNFSVDDIRRCHRMGRSAGDKKPRTIAVKFEAVSVRDEIWFAKAKFKGSGITMSEFLTKQRHDIFMAARDRFGVTRCWTREGIIYISSTDGSRHRIVSQSELDKIIKSDEENQTTKQISTVRIASKSKRMLNKKLHPIYVVGITLLCSLAVTASKPWHQTPIWLIDFEKKDLFFDRVVFLTLNIKNYTGDGRISKNVAPGVLIDKKRVLTSYNAFRNLTKTKSRRVELPFKTFYDYDCVKIVCGRPLIPMNDDELSDDEWHGFDKKHCPVHDLMVVRLETELDVWEPEYEEPCEVRHSPENVANKVEQRCGPIITNLTTADSKVTRLIQFVSLGLTKDRIKRFFGLELGEYEDSDHVVVDCDDWLPKNWGYFICLTNDDARFKGFGSGSLLFSERKLFGVESFAIWRGKEGILVFTDIRPYLTHIAHTCTDDDLF